MLFETPTDCWATGIGASVDEDGRIYVTGQSGAGGCTVAFGSSAGTPDWAVALGNWDAGWPSARTDRCMSLTTRDPMWYGPSC
jgi:hypothetical protein